MFLSSYHISQIVCVVFLLLCVCSASQLHLNVGPQVAGELTYFQITGTSLHRGQDVDFFIAESPHDGNIGHFFYIFRHTTLYPGILPNITFFEQSWTKLCGEGEGCSMCYDVDTNTFTGLLRDNGQRKLTYTAFMRTFSDTVVKCPFVIAQHKAFPHSPDTPLSSPRQVTVGEPYLLAEEVFIDRVYDHHVVFTIERDMQYVHHEPHVNSLIQRHHVVNLTISNAKRGVYHLQTNTIGPYDPFMLVKPLTWSLLGDISQFLYCNETLAPHAATARIMVDDTNDFAVYLYIPHPITDANPTTCRLFINPVYATTQHDGFHLTIAGVRSNSLPPTTPSTTPPIYGTLSNISSNPQIVIPLPAGIFTGQSFVTFHINGHHDPTVVNESLEVICNIDNAIGIDIDFTQSLTPDAAGVEVKVVITSGSRQYFPSPDELLLRCQFMIKWNQITLIPANQRKAFGNQMDISTHVHVPSMTTDGCGRGEGGENQNTNANDSSANHCTANEKVTTYPVHLDVVDNQHHSYLFRPSFSSLESGHFVNSNGKSHIWASFTLDAHQAITSLDTIVFVLDYEPFFFPYHQPRNDDKDTHVIPPHHPFTTPSPTCSVYHRGVDHPETESGAFARGVPVTTLRVSQEYETSIISVAELPMEAGDELRIDCHYPYSFENIPAEMADAFINIGVITEKDKREGRRLNPTLYTFTENSVALPTHDPDRDAPQPGPDDPIDDGMEDVLELTVTSFYYPRSNLPFSHGNFAQTTREHDRDNDPVPNLETNLDVLRVILHELSQATIREPDPEDIRPKPSGDHAFKNLRIDTVGVPSFNHYLWCAPIDLSNGGMGVAASVGYVSTNLMHSHPDPKDAASSPSTITMAEFMMYSTHPSKHCKYGVQVRLQIPYNYDTSNHYLHTYQFPDTIQVTSDEVYKQRAPRQCLSYYRIGHAECPNPELLEPNSECVNHAMCDSGQCVNGRCAHASLQYGQLLLRHFHLPPSVDDSASVLSLAATAALVLFATLFITII